MGSHVVLRAACEGQRRCRASAVSLLSIASAQVSILITTFSDVLLYQVVTTRTMTLYLLMMEGLVRAVLRVSQSNRHGKSPLLWFLAMFLLQYRRRSRRSIRSQPLELLESVDSMSLCTLET